MPRSDNPSGHHESGLYGMSGEQGGQKTCPQNLTTSVLPFTLTHPSLQNRFDVKAWTAVWPPQLVPTAVSKSLQQDTDLHLPGHNATQ